MNTFRVFLVSLALACQAAVAHEPVQTIPEPGYRPSSIYAKAFLDNLDAATIVVLPSVLRRSDRAAQSFESQSKIVELLNARGDVTAISAMKRFDLGALRREAQWDVFQFSMTKISESLAGFSTDADYILVMEFLVPGDQSVFGIQCYVLDRNGNNAFSFLLNSHHRLFADEQLFADDASEKARTGMIQRATRIAIEAFDRQIQLAREIGDQAPVT